MKKFNKSKYLLMITVFNLMLSMNAFAGPVGDFVNSGKAATYLIQVLFGIAGGGLIFNIIHEFAEKQSVSDAGKKILGLIICIAMVAKPALLTSAISTLGL